MKRHASLVLLSRDHHHGLVMAERLILGRSTNPNADWPEDRTEQAARLIAFFESDLRPHFDAEEAYVFPAAAKEMEEGGRAAAALVADHDAMRALIRSFEADAVSRLDDRLPAFGFLLRAHIRREEQDLFEAMQAACGATTLAAIGAALAAAPLGRGAACAVPARTGLDGLAVAVPD